MSPPPPAVVQAQRRFAAWLRWYLKTYPVQVPSQAALGRALGVTPATVSYLLKAGSTQAPDFKTLVAARALMAMPLDVLLFSDPPR